MELRVWIPGRMVSTLTCLLFKFECEAFIIIISSLLDNCRTFLGVYVCHPGLTCERRLCTVCRKDYMTFILFQQYFLCSIQQIT